MIDIATKLGEILAAINGLEKRLSTLEAQDRVGNFTAGSVLFAGSTGNVSQDNASLFFDDTNNRLGIQTTVPSGYLHIKFTGGTKIGLEVEDNIASSDTIIKLINPDGNIASGSYWIRAINGNADVFYVRGDGVSLFTGQATIKMAGGSKDLLTIEDTAVNSDNLLKLYDSGGTIGAGSKFIVALKGATEQFSVRGDGVVNALTQYNVNGTQVVNTRKTGWAAATNTKLRTTFDTTTVTLPNLAARVGALIDDLISHGLIGT